MADTVDYVSCSMESPGIAQCCCSNLTKQPCLAKVLRNMFWYLQHTCRRTVFLSNRGPSGNGKPVKLKKNRDPLPFTAPVLVTVPLLDFPVLLLVPRVVVVEPFVPFTAGAGAPDWRLGALQMYDKDPT